MLAGADSWQVEGLKGEGASGPRSMKLGRRREGDRKVDAFASVKRQGVALTLTIKKTPRAQLYIRTISMNSSIVLHHMGSTLRFIS